MRGRLQLLRTAAMVAIIAAVLMFAPPFNGALRASYAFDQRAETSILFIGNNRTADNGMPAIVQRIADSAGYPHKLRIAVHAPSNGSMTEHQANPKVHDLIAQGDWDYVVLQAQSTEQIDKPNWGKWWKPAIDLIEEVKDTGSEPWMFVTWRYTDQCTAEDKWDAPANEAMHTAIQQQHAHLVRQTDVQLVNVGVVWDMLLRKDIDYSLYNNCSQPSVHGSYLSALMVFGDMLGGDIAKVTYTPDGVKPQQAEQMRTAVSRFQQSRSAPKVDQSGKGAVLCLWSIYVSMQQGIELCGLELRSSDADLQRSISRIEEFALENTTTGVSAGDLRDYKADLVEDAKRMSSSSNREGFCRDVIHFRDNLGAQVIAQTDDLLSVRREPLWAPCI
jgi:hypothetical protein